MDYIFWQESQAFKKTENALIYLFLLKRYGKGNIFVKSFGMFKMFKKKVCYLINILMRIVLR